MAGSYLQFSVSAAVSTALTDNWTCSAAHRHATASISSYYRTTHMYSAVYAVARHTPVID